MKALLTAAVFPLILFSCKSDPPVDTLRNDCDERIAEMATKARAFDSLQVTAYTKLDTSGMYKYLPAFKAVTSITKEYAMASVAKYKTDVPMPISLESIHLPEETVANFAELYRNQKIDGLRVYLAKHVHDGLFTFILVGTKTNLQRPIMVAGRVTGYVHEDVMVPSQINPNVMVSIQNFGDPCPPPKCDGNTIGGGH